jgi:hypothetical protein
VINIVRERERGPASRAADTLNRIWLPGIHACPLGVGASDRFTTHSYVYVHTSTCTISPLRIIKHAYEPEHLRIAAAAAASYSHSQRIQPFPAHADADTTDDDDDQRVNAQAQAPGTTPRSWSFMHDQPAACVATSACTHARTRPGIRWAAGRGSRRVVVVVPMETRPNRTDRVVASNPSNSLLSRARRAAAREQKIYLPCEYASKWPS